MKRIKQVLNTKGADVYSIDMNECVFDAIKLMAEKEIGALVVTDGEKLAGIISERDYTRKVILKGRTSQQTRVEEIMTSDVITVHPKQTIKECMSLMTQHRIRHLPVIEGERLIGMLSIGDLVKAIIAEQQFTIEQLQSYIRG
ncbi:MAG: CBS domain-containing protein [Deltaproteobacteria bacterium]|nr:CBS domain-containing protein [Deltaproteobacteria bacterium]